MITREFLEKRAAMSEEEIEASFVRCDAYQKIKCARDVYRNNAVRVQILSRQDLADLSVKDEPYAMISICDPGQNQSQYPDAWVSIPDSQYLDAVCRLEFYDVEEEIIDIGRERTYPTISDEQAKKIASFAYTYQSSQSLPAILVVHCEAGISRSSGVALAIARFFDESEDGSWFFSRFYPNKTVYMKVYRALCEHAKLYLKELGDGK